MAKLTNKEVLDLFTQLEAVHRERKLLEEKEAFIRSQLLLTIPEGGAKAGVLHEVRLGKSIAWSQAAKRIVSELVPKTKSAQVDAIVEEFTKTTKAHLFRAAK